MSANAPTWREDKLAVSRGEQTGVFELHAVRHMYRWLRCVDPSFVSSEISSELCGRSSFHLGGRGHEVTLPSPHSRAEGDRP